MKESGMHNNAIVEEESDCLGRCIQFSQKNASTTMDMECHDKFSASASYHDG